MMDEKESFAREIAGDNYGLSLEPSPSRTEEKGRLLKSEREAFNAGWEASKQYHESKQ